MRVDAQFGGDRQVFLDALGNVGTSEDDVRDEIRRQLRLRDLLDEVDGDVEIGADELRGTLEAEESQRRWSAWLEDRLHSAEIEYADAYRPEDPFEVSAWPGSTPSDVPAEEPR